MVLVEHIQHQRLQRIRADQPMVCTQQPALVVAPSLDLQTPRHAHAHSGGTKQLHVLGDMQQEENSLTLV